MKGNPIGNKTVYFRYDNKQVTATTDKNGNATITISGLKNGDYNITYGFDGVEGYCSSSSSSILHVVNSTTILTGNDLTMVYNDGSEFKVKFKMYIEENIKQRKISGKLPYFYHSFLKC